MVLVGSKVVESSMMLWFEMARLLGSDMGFNLLVGTSLTSSFSVEVHKVCQAEVLVVVEQVLGFMVVCTAEQGEGQMLFMDMEVVVEVVDTLLDFFCLTDFSLTNFLFSDFKSLTSHFNCLTLSPRFSDF